MQYVARIAIMRNTQTYTVIPILYVQDVSKNRGSGGWGEGGARVYISI